MLPPEPLGLVVSDVLTRWFFAFQTQHDVTHAPPRALNRSLAPMMLGDSESLVCFCIVFYGPEIQACTNVGFTTAGFLHTQKPDIGIERSIADEVEQMGEFRICERLRHSILWALENRVTRIRDPAINNISFYTVLRNAGMGYRLWLRIQDGFSTLRLGLWCGGDDIVCGPDFWFGHLRAMPADHYLNGLCVLVQGFLRFPNLNDSVAIIDGEGDVMKPTFWLAEAGLVEEFENSIVVMALLSVSLGPFLKLNYTFRKNFPLCF